MSLPSLASPALLVSAGGYYRVATS